MKKGSIGDLLTVSEDESVNIMVERKETGGQVWSSGWRLASDLQPMAKRRASYCLDF